MKLGIRFHLVGLSLSDAVFINDKLLVEHYRQTVHNWEQKDDLQPLKGVDLNHVAIDKTVIQLNDQRYWLYAAVDPASNWLLHIRLYLTRTQAVAEMVLSELREKHLIDDAVILVDEPP